MFCVNRQVIVSDNFASCKILNQKFMATVKIKFRPSSVDGREGTVYYQVIHGRVTRQINTSYKLFPAEWDKRHSRIVIISPDKDRQQYLLSLDKK